MSGFNPCCIGLAIAAWARPRLAIRAAGFNPCCIGLAIAAPAAFNYDAAAVFVSILVVLD